MPRSLPACCLGPDGLTFARLHQFSIEAILAAFPQIRPERLVIAIDCVLGLPASLAVPWREALSLTLKFEGYGRKPAAEYFRTIGQGQVPRREIEYITKANSMFQERPFQRNIQTGTFRFWKEMAQHPDWFYVPYLTREPSPQGRVPIFEGFPSLSWKQIFGFKTRKPADLPEAIHRVFPEANLARKDASLLRKDPHFADAAVLAFAMRTLYRAELKRKPDVEGWILGAERS
jgi:hypothetical protein